MGKCKNNEISFYKPKSIMQPRIRQAFLVFFAFLLFHLVTYFLDPYANNISEYFDHSTIEIIVSLLFNLLFCFLISEFSTILHKKLNLRFPWFRNRSKRLLIEFFLNFLVVVFLIFLNFFCCFILYSLDDSSSLSHAMTFEEKLWIKQWLVVSIAISFLIIVINIVSLLVDSFIETTIEFAEHKVKIAELKQASIEAELNAMKLQLDPHFIFNNLSILSELILKDQNLGYEYSENFSKVYRFLLVNSKKDIITVEEEINFLNCYLFLVKQRVGDGVIYEIDISDEDRSQLIPPLTLQLLVENAIKHNVTNRKKPLIIRIESIGNSKIQILNTLALIKKNKLPSAGIGLDNIKRRFSLLGKTPPEVFFDLSVFKVNVHLIKYGK